jgi:N4-gp56 family major capsid protein
MSQNYASTYKKVIDEVFSLKSKTEGIINKGIKLDYLGVNAVSIYGVGTVAEGNYTRSGSNRFGALAELDTTKQTFTLSQDKSFTFSIDRGNFEDSMMVTESGAALKRQIEKVCVPNTDIYRLTTLEAYAVANSQMATNSGTTATAANVFAKILDMQALLDNLFVPEDGRVLFVTPSVLNLLKQNQSTGSFVQASDLSQKMLISGQVGEIDGVKVVKVPTSYVPAKTELILVHEEVLIAPHKFDTYRILKEVQGVDGWVVEGRRYFDAFIPTNRGKALVASLSA